MFGDLYLLLAVEAGEDSVAVDGGIEGIFGVGSLVELCRFYDYLLVGRFCLSGCILGNEFLSELQRADIVIGLSVFACGSGQLIEILGLLEHVAGDRRSGAMLEGTYHRHRGFHLNFIYLIRQ